MENKNNNIYFKQEEVVAAGGGKYQVESVEREIKTDSLEDVMTNMHLDEYYKTLIRWYIKTYGMYIENKKVLVPETAIPQMCDDVKQRSRFISRVSKNFIKDFDYIVVMKSDFPGYLDLGDAYEKIEYMYLFTCSGFSLIQQMDKRFLKVHSLCEKIIKHMQV